MQRSAGRLEILQCFRVLHGDAQQRLRCTSRIAAALFLDHGHWLSRLKRKISVESETRQALPPRW